MMTIQSAIAFILVGAFGLGCGPKWGFSAALGIGALALFLILF